MRLRAGRAGSGKGAARMVAQAIATARAAGATGTILVRGDWAYGTRTVVNAYRRAGPAGDITHRQQRGHRHDPVLERRRGRGRLSMPGLGAHTEGTPTNVDRKRQLNRHVMRLEFMSRAEVLSQLRLHGIEDISRVERAYIEPNGMISVITGDGAENQPVE